MSCKNPDFLTFFLQKKQLSHMITAAVIIRPSIADSKPTLYETTHGPYLSDLEIGRYKAIEKFAFFALLFTFTYLPYFIFQIFTPVSYYITQYVTSHSSQLSLAIPSWVGAVSTSKSWGVKDAIH